MKQRIKLLILFIFKKLKIIDRIPFGLRIINFIFQKALRINSNIDIGVNFTSKINSAKKIIYHKDENTLASFATSGCCYIQGYNSIYLGKNILFAKGLNLISANHSIDKLDKWDKVDPIIIGDNVWIGVDVTILPSVEIGNNCIIGAGSVVTKSFKEDNLIIAGNPAKIIKRI